MGGSFEQEFVVDSGDFNNAGKVSRTIKSTLSQLGIETETIRKIAIASYESEINLIIHSVGGVLRLTLEPNCVTIDAADEGPGIENIDLAMTEGWSTASETAREMGFGAGMGLSNMRRSADSFDIASELGIGTRITMKFDI